MSTYPGFFWATDAANYTRRTGRAADYTSGRIERVDIETGAAEVLYDSCDGVPLKGPNDIVFDTQGGFWFTDLGKTYGRVMDRGAVYYARTDGSLIKEAIYPIMTPNGVGHHAVGNQPADRGRLAATGSGAQRSVYRA